MESNSFVSDAENQLRLFSTALTGPYEGECVLCYVWRMLELGCTGLRWAVRYRDLRAPRATALERRLGDQGGFCDCEIFLNCYELRPELWAQAEEYDEDGSADLEDPSYPDPLPPCRGVRRGSSQGCRLWVRRRYGW